MASTRAPSESTGEAPPTAHGSDDGSDPSCLLPDDGVEAAILRVLDEARADPAPGEPVTSGMRTSVAWDHRSEPRHFRKVVGQLGLTAAERATLFRNGFVVPERLSLGNYGYALHEIHRRELPLYVSADAVMHAIFLSHESLLAAHDRTLAHALPVWLATLHGALPAAATRYAPEVARDLDLYLGVARRLAGEGSGVPIPEDPAAAALAAKILAGRGLGVVELFGRDRVVDFSAYTPRGRYTEGGTHEQEYFRTFTWLSRLELNLVSRSSRSSAPVRDPRETPREATLGLALADLASRAYLLEPDGVTRTRVLDALLAATRGFRALAGAGETVPLEELARVAASLPDLRDVERASAALTQAIGRRFERTAAYQPMPWGTEELPAIATLFPAAVPPDTGIFPILSLSGSPSTRIVRAADIAAAIGNERARRHLAPDVAELALAARHELAGPIPTTDLYRSWLGAVRALDRRAPNAADVEPSFMRTEAYADARLSSELVAYGQLRHAYVLYSAQAYDSLGCEIPDAWVEPVLPVFDALLAYVAHARAASTALWGHDESDYYDRLRGVLLTLRTIAEHELAGRALSAAEVGFLRMVAEYVPEGTYDGRVYAPARFDGWYPRMFPTRGAAFLRGSFVSDVSTSPTRGAVTYLGATQPRIGLFVVDTGGEPRLLVGPVARGIERLEPLAAERLDDRSLRDYAPDALLPWERSYLVRGPLEVHFGLEVRDDAVVLTGDPGLGPVTIEVLDRHGEVALQGRGPVSPQGGGPSQPIAVAGLRANEPHAYRVKLADGSAWEPNFGWGKFGDRADHAWE